MTKPISRIECAHCGEVVGSYHKTCPYCGYRLVDANKTMWRNLNAWPMA